MNKLGTEIERTVSEFSGSIKNAIAEGKWDTLNDVLQQRQQVLEEFFSNLKKGENTVEIKGMIKKIQQEDTLFLRLVQTREKEMKEKQSSLKQGQESVKAYQQL